MTLSSFITDVSETIDPPKSIIFMKFSLESVKIKFSGFKSR